MRRHDLAKHQGARETWERGVWAGPGFRLRTGRGHGARRVARTRHASGSRSDREAPEGRGPRGKTRPVRLPCGDAPLPPCRCPGHPAIFDEPRRVVSASPGGPDTARVGVAQRREAPGKAAGPRSDRAGPTLLRRCRPDTVPRPGHPAIFDEPRRVGSRDRGGPDAARVGSRRHGRRPGGRGPGGRPGRSDPSRACGHPDTVPVSGRPRRVDFPTEERAARWLARPGWPGRGTCPGPSQRRQAPGGRGIPGNLRPIRLLLRRCPSATVPVSRPTRDP